MSSLRDRLLGVPQDPRYHPEGDVWTHTRLVRRALTEAIEMSIASHVLLRQLTARERNLLRLAAWCHDLGKASATRVVDGRTLAPGHETAGRFNAECRRLGPLWKRIWVASSFEDRKDLVYLVTRHMAISDREGLTPRVARSLRGDDPKLRRRAQRLVAFMIMDRLGCASPTRLADARLVVEAAERAVATS
jgi:hypothetical protein